MIKKYTMKNGETRYLFQTYLGVDPLTGKEKRTTRRGFKTIKEAKQAERNLLLNAEEYGLPSNENYSDPTFEEIAGLWLENYKTTVKASTFELTKTRLKQITQDNFKDLKIKGLSVAYCQKVAISLSKKYALYGQYLSIIQRVFKYAVLIDIIPSNPFDKVIRPKGKEAKKKINYLDKEELKHFLECASSASVPYFFPLVYLISYTGLRIGEALALKWSDIDFETKKVSITKTVAKINGKQIIQTPKTKNSKRIVSVDSSTLDVLKKWKKEQIKLYFKVGKPFKNEDNFIFTNQYASWIHANDFTSCFKRFIKRNGLKKITPHGLRHTHASLLFASGVEPKNISDRLGHSSVQITLDLYTHISDNQRTDTLDKFLGYMVL